MMAASASPRDRVASPADGDGRDDNETAPGRREGGGGGVGLFPHNDDDDPGPTTTKTTTMMMMIAEEGRGEAPRGRDRGVCLARALGMSSRCECAVRNLVGVSTDDVRYDRPCVRAVIPGGWRDFASGNLMSHWT